MGERRSGVETHRTVYQLTMSEISFLFNVPRKEGRMVRGGSGGALLYPYQQLESTRYHYNAIRVLREKKGRARKRE